MISNLQVLRGLAALAVVFYHTAFTINGSVHTDFQAVSVFFVISGFIMTYITRNDTDRFLANRLIRIVPLYWLCTLLPVASTWLKGSGRMWSDASLKTVLESLFFVPYRNSSGDVQPLLAVGWTLNLEMFFYLLFGVALMSSARWGPLLVCGALIALKIVHGPLACSMLFCEFYAHDYTMFLVAGILSYYIWSLVETHALAWRAISIPAALIAIVTFIMWNIYPPFASTLQQPFRIPLYYIMPPMLVIAALLLHSARLECQMRIPLILGDISFALYLTHTIVMEIYRVGRNKLVGDQIAVLDPRESVFAMASILIICSLVAVVVHYRVERPILKWLRRNLFQPRGQRSDQTAVAFRH
jgi:exopolysaccharide production protein ExoZ